jgi:hypothetical protein
MRGKVSPWMCAYWLKEKLWAEIGGGTLFQVVSFKSYVNLLQKSGKGNLIYSKLQE